MSAIAPSGEQASLYEYIAQVNSGQVSRARTRGAMAARKGSCRRKSSVSAHRVSMYQHAFALLTARSGWNTARLPGLVDFASRLPCTNIPGRAYWQEVTLQLVRAGEGDGEAAEFACKIIDVDSAMPNLPEFDLDSDLPTIHIRIAQESCGENPVSNSSMCRSAPRRDH
jgi:hypothetical protein